MTLLAIILVAAFLAVKGDALAAPTLPPQITLTLAVGQDVESKAFTYDAHLSAARAFHRLGEYARAVDEYRLALVAAPDKNARDVARSELEAVSHFWNQVGSWLRARWLYWSLGCLFLASLGLIWLLGRFGGSRNGRVAIRSTDASLPAEYLKLAILAVSDDLKEQRTLAAQMGEHCTVSTSPTPRATLRLSVQSLDAMTFAQGWSKLLLLLPYVFGHARAYYRVDVRLLPAGENLGINVLLRSGRKQRKCWRHIVSADQLGEAVADIAYYLVVLIEDQRHRSR